MMNTAVIETKKTLEEVCGFSAKGAWTKIRQLRDRYGSRRLSEMTGLTQGTINSYCSASYMKKHSFQEETWEKYFGKWGLKDPVFPNANQLQKNDAIEDSLEQGDEIMVVVNEPVEAEEKPVEETKKARLILEVPRLEELEEALKHFGFKMIIE